MGMCSRAGYRSSDVPWLFTGTFYPLTPLTTRSPPAHTPLTSVSSACLERVMRVFNGNEVAMGDVGTGEYW